MNTLKAKMYAIHAKAAKKYTVHMVTLEGCVPDLDSGAAR